MTVYSCSSNDNNNPYIRYPITQSLGPKRTTGGGAGRKNTGGSTRPSKPTDHTINQPAVPINPNLQRSEVGVRDPSESCDRVGSGEIAG